MSQQHLILFTRAVQVSGTSPSLLSTRCVRCSNDPSAVRRQTRSFCWWLSLSSLVRAQRETPYIMESLLSLTKHVKTASRPMEDDTSHKHWPWASFHPTLTPISHCRYSSALHRRISIISMTPTAATPPWGTCVASRRILRAEKQADELIDSAKDI